MIARVVLLMSALAGMALGTVAHAQIVFRNASSAAALQAPAAPTVSSGTTGTITFSTSTNAQNDDATSLTINAPASTGSGHFLVAQITFEKGSPITVTEPAGWTLVRRDDRGGDIGQAIYYRVATGSEPASYSWNFSQKIKAAGGILRYIGVDTGNPIIASSGRTGDGNTLTADSVASVPNSMLVALFGLKKKDTTMSTPAGMDERYLFQNPNDVRIKAADEIGPANPTGNRVSNAGSGDKWVAQLVTLRPASNVLTIIKPAGTVAGDVLVASIGFRPNCCDTPAANYGISALDLGWTALPRLDNAPGAGILPSNSLAVYWKVAGASEPAAYRWSFPVSGNNNNSDGSPGTTATTFGSAAGGILKFSGVEAVAPVIDVEEKGRQTTAGDQTTPSITTAAANTMLVTSHSYASPTTAAWTAPSGMTSPAAVDVKAGAQSTAIFYGVQALAGPTGTKQAVPTPDDDIGNAHILALRSATPGTALTIPIPQGTVAGDVMIASIAVRGPDRSITKPSGWDEVRRTEQTTGTANLQVFYVRAAGASEPSSYTWTLAGTNTGAVGGILSFSGVDTTAPIVTNAIDNHGGNLDDGAAGLIRANEITANVAGTVAVSAHSLVSTANWTPAAPVDVASRTVPNGVGISLAMYHYPAQAGPGPTGNKDATASNDFDTGLGQILTLKPAAPPAPAVGGFNAYESSTAPGAITGVIKTKIAGSAISLDIIALNPAKTAILTSFADTVRVEVLDASNNSGALDGDGCRPTWTVIQTLSPDPAFIAGDNGRKTISFTQANSYPNTRLRISYPVGAPTATGCSTDNFAIRPNTFASFAVTDTDWLTPGTGRVLGDAAFGTVTHKAGRPFSVRASAVNAAGTPAVTTNYTGMPAATLSACAGAACTATFGTLTLTTTFVAGQLASDAASYDEVGSFRLQLVDTSFASVDASDGSSAAERDVASAAIDVGRFVPDHFDVSGASLANRSGLGCSPASSFTYMNEPMTLQFTLTARNAAGATTAKYAGSHARLGLGTASNFGFGARSGTTNLSARIDPAVTTSGTWTSGVAPVTATLLAVDRANPDNPDGPYLALAFGIAPADSDGVAMGTLDLDVDSVGGNDHANLGVSTEVRFGRLVLQNAYGPVGQALPIPIEVQYWNGTAFVINALDGCTTLARSDIALSFSGAIAACDTSVQQASLAFAAGRSTLTLAAPGAGKTGTVLLTPQLGTAAGTYCPSVGVAAVAATASPAVYLLGRWNDAANPDGNAATSYDDKPAGQAGFGLYGSQPRNFIFFRENY